MKKLSEIQNWQDAINHVVHGDCLELMKMMPDKCIDLVLTDPPYGIGGNKITNGKQGEAGKHYGKISGKPYKMPEWDDKIPDKKIFNEIFRISKNQIIWGGNYFDLPPSRGWCVWDKMVAEGFYSCSQAEIAYTSFDIRMFIFRYSNRNGQGEKQHPTAKPLELGKWCIENYTKPEERENMIIFDPFGGSFTFARAAKDFGIDFISCDTDEDYCKIGEERLRQENLF